MDAIQDWRGPTRNPVRVIVAAADPHLRRVVAQELAADRRTDLIAQAATVAEARRHMAQAASDVALLDLRLGLEHVLELIGLWRAVPSPAEVVVICAKEEEDAALQALEAGAAGCLVRNMWRGSFVQAVLEVAHGGAALTPSLARRLLGRHVPATAAAPAVGPPSRLTDRELEVLALVARGLRTRDIGLQLAISSDTVNAHIKSIYRKLQAHSRAQAVRIATQIGLL